MNEPTLGELVHAFFADHLPCQKGLRPSSIKSYRDAMALFLNHVAQSVGRKLSRVTLEDLTCERVLAFLSALESDRHNHIRTRNHRLAALRTFFEFVVHRRPDGLKEAERIAAIPTKRAPPPETRFMERDEVKELFDSLPTSGWSALRDHAVLLFLYNTGARVQEVADLCVKNLELTPPARAHLHGKGDKWRTCPLWKETARLIGQLLSTRARADPEGHVFLSRRGDGLTRFGIYKIVRRHTHGRDHVAPSRSYRRISPHVFRHTTAVHLLEAGVDVNTIRGWLGHVSLDTTNRYAEINIRMKQEALKTCEPPSSASSEAFPRRPVWKDDTDLLKWLKSL